MNTNMLIIPFAYLVLPFLRDSFFFTHSLARSLVCSLYEYSKAIVFNTICIYDIRTIFLYGFDAMIIMKCLEWNKTNIKKTYNPTRNEMYVDRSGRRNEPESNKKREAVNVLCEFFLLLSFTHSNTEYNNRENNKTKQKFGELYDKVYMYRRWSDMEKASKRKKRRITIGIRCKVLA